MSSLEKYLLSRAFYRFFNSTTLFQKLHDNGLYGLVTARSNRINMVQIKKDKEMYQRDYHWKFYNHIGCIKWFDNNATWKPFLEEITSILTIQKSMFRFYLRLFFDLFDVALVNSFIAYKNLENKDLILKEFKIYIALKLIASFVSQKPSCPNHRPSKRIKILRHGWIPPSLLPFFLEQGYDVLYAPKEEKKTEHLLHVHDAKHPFVFKKKGTIFYYVTYKPAVTHILKALFEHDFYDVLKLYYTFLLKNLLAFI